MKIKSLMLAAAALAASQAMAAPVDGDGNGTFSMEEMAEAYPDLTEEQFATIDANEDGEIDEMELNDAIEAGTIAD